MNSPARNKRLRVASKGKSGKVIDFPVGTDFSEVEDSKEGTLLIAKIFDEAVKNAAEELKTKGLENMIARKDCLVLVSPTGEETIVYQLKENDTPYYLKSKKGIVLHGLKSK